MAIASTNSSAAYCGRLLLTTVFFLLVPTAQAQLGSCSLMQPHARDYLNLLTLDCASDRSQCTASTGCQCQDDNPAFTTAAATCSDGCLYFWGDDPIRRSTSAGSFARDRVMDHPIFQLLVGIRHSFDPFLATEQGSIEYIYYPGSTEETLFLPELGGSCSAHLDGQPCACSQHYCDTEGTTFGNVVDCTGLEGGGVVDFCNPPLPLTDESTKMEILLLLPFVACTDPSQIMHSGGGNPSPPIVVSPTPGTGPSSGPLTDSSGYNASFIGSLLTAILFCFASIF